MSKIWVLFALPEISGQRLVAIKGFVPLNIVIDMNLHNELFVFRMHHSKSPMSEARARLALSPSPPMQICADCSVEVNLK